MPLNNRISQLLEEKISETQLGKSSFLTVYTEPESHEKDELLKLIGKSDSRGFTILEDRSGNTVKPPYDPFLSFIARKTASMDKEQIETLLQSLNFYSAHIDLLLAFLTNGQPRRKERILHDEFTYDNQVLMESIWTLFKILYRGEQVIAVIHHGDFLPVSTCRFLTKLSGSEESFPLLTILCISNAMTNLQESEEREKALTELRVKGGLLRLTEERRAPHIHERQFPSLDKTFLLLKSNIEFLAYEDVLEIFASLEQRAEFNMKALSDEFRAKLYLTKMKALYYSGDYHNALQQNSLYLKITVETGRKELIAESYWASAVIHFAMQSPFKALSDLKRSMSLSEVLSDVKIRYYNIYLLLLIDAKERVLEGDIWREYYFEFIKMGRELGFSSTLSCWLARPERLDYTAEIETIDSLQKEAIDLCKKSGNLFRLAAAYHNRASAFIYREDYQSVQYYYSKCSKLKEKLGNTLEIAYTNNGYGRYFYQIGDFPQADEYYQKAINAARQVGDYRETAMSMCNIGSNYLYSFDFKRALLYLENLNELMSLMKIRSLSFHSEFQVRVLLAFAHLKNGNTAKAKDLIRDLKKESEQREKLTTLPYETLSEELLDFYLLITVYYSEVGKKEKFLQAVGRCEQYFLDNRHIHNFFSPVLFYEIGNSYYKFNMTDHAQKAFSEGLNSIDQDLHPYYREILREKIKNPSLEPVIFREADYLVNFEMIKLSAQNSLAINDLQKKVDEIHFLNSVQELMAETLSKSEYIAGSMDRLSHYFRADFIVLFHKSGDQKTILYNQSRFTAEEMDNFLLSIESLSTPKSPVILNNEQLDTFYSDSRLKSLIALPIESIDYFLICGTSTTDAPLNRMDYQFLSLFTGFLRSGIEKSEYISSIEEANRKLELSATTDPLTGLFNRKALMEKMKEERKRFCRYHEEDNKHFSILFIDLDNFKYYNDNFGHDAGDLILTLFSAILNRVCRECDFISRYGGDEFLILLPETSQEGARKQGKRILEEMAKVGFFHNDLEGYLKRKIEVPAGDRISCSIGISSCRDCRDKSIESLITESDTAVYQAKRAGKGQVSVFQ